MTDTGTTVVANDNYWNGVIMGQEGTEVVEDCGSCAAFIVGLGERCGTAISRNLGF
jgi:hypothetical protein